MPYPPIKTEEYQNIGGINLKASPYASGVNEVIDILNLDYTSPGAYTTRPGSTGWLYGSSAISTIVGTGRGSTSNIQSIDSVFQFSELNGNSYLLFTYQGNLFFQSQSGITNFNLFGLNIPSILSFAAFVDYVFIAGTVVQNGITAVNGMYKYNGNDATQYTLPVPVSNGGLVQNSQVSSATLWPGMTGIFVYGFAWQNERGYIGPIASYNYSDFTDIQYDFPGIQFAIAGGSFIKMDLDIEQALPLAGNFGISYLVIFRAGPLPYPGAGTPTPGGGLFITSIPAWYGLTTVGITSNFQFIDPGSSYGPVNLPGITLGGQQLYFTMTPNFLTVYNNSLFLGGFGYTQNGFSAASNVGNLPSTLYFSAIGEPELIGSTQSFEVRTNDSDELTGFYNYISQLMVFKNRSFFTVTGTGSAQGGQLPYSLSQISADYGCISNRAIVTFNSLLWFLDRKGICQYDGANVYIVSNRVEKLFQSMNLSASEQVAAMIHVKDRNEIWTAIPINGATFNNALIVYDYVANAFSVWEGPQVSSLGLAFDPNQVFTPIYGNYSGVVSYFNKEFFMDNSNSFTCSVTPRYFGGQGKELGYSVEKMFRRAYFDITDSNNTGQTTLMNVNFIADFGSSTVIQNQTFAMAGGHTQMRLDFGIPGKALSFQLSYVPQTSALNFNGYTIEYRYQRNV